MSPHRQASLTCSTRAHRPARGLSLIELVVCLATAATLLAGAVQGLRTLGSRQTVEAAASLLETDLRHARSLALSTDRPVRFEVQAPAPRATCYVVYSGPSGSCRCQADGTAQCLSGGQVWRVAAQPPEAGVRVLHGGRALTFDPSKGTVTPTATLVVADADGQAIHQVVNIMGRVRSCSPQGLAGLRPCT